MALKENFLSWMYALVGYWMQEGMPKHEGDTKRQQKGIESERERAAKIESEKEKCEGLAYVKQPYT